MPGNQLVSTVHNTVAYSHGALVHTTDSIDFLGTTGTTTGTTGAATHLIAVIGLQNNLVYFSFWQATVASKAEAEARAKRRAVSIRVRLAGRICILHM